MSDAARPSRRGRGRPPGSASDTRTEILRAAHRAFAADGFEGASMRRIARDAGVDPALVHHYFTDKVSLFLQSTRIAFDPRPLISRVTPGDRSRLAERLLCAVLPVWDSPLGQSLVVAARKNPERFADYGQVIGGVIAASAAQVLADVPAGERAIRIAQVESIMSGLFIAKYLLRLEPIASLPRETIIRRWVPLLQASIDGKP